MNRKANKNQRTNLFWTNFIYFIHLCHEWKKKQTEKAITTYNAIKMVTQNRVYSIELHEKKSK